MNEYRASFLPNRRQNKIRERDMAKFTRTLEAQVPEPAKDTAF